VTDVTTTTISLGWEPPVSDGGSDDVTQYSVDVREEQQQRDAADYATLATLSGRITSYTVEQLHRGRLYRFRVRAKNAAGYSQSAAELDQPVQLKALGMYAVKVKGKGSRYSTTERRVPELIPVLGSQPASDVSHKPSGRLSLLFARPAEGCYQFCCLVNRGTMGVSSLPKTVTRQRRDCDLNPGPYAPESSTLTTGLPSHPCMLCKTVKFQHSFIPYCLDHYV